MYAEQPFADMPWPFVAGPCPPETDGAVAITTTLAGNRAAVVNIAPPGHLRVCTFRCAYCQIPAGERRGPGIRWPTAGDTESALRSRLHEVDAIESVSIVGRGEPTLHPHFIAVATSIVSEVGRQRPGVPVYLITNGSGFLRAEVRRATRLFESSIVRFDPASERLDRPEDRFPSAEIEVALESVQSVAIQACLASGPEGNADPESISQWLAALDRIRPRWVVVYPMAALRENATLSSPGPDRLAEIEAAVRSMGIPVLVNH